MSLSRGGNDKTCEETKTGKQRFKGVETFLRRIAFNLGNTPSQTDVKIISCIPIDVTDLQNKIISLERQLAEATKCKSVPKDTSVHTALIEPTKRYARAGLSCKCSDVRPVILETTKEYDRMPLQCKEESSKIRNSVVTVFPTLSHTRLKQNSTFNSNGNWEEKKSLDSNDDRNHKSFFKRCKKKKPMKKKGKPKTQLVYYAHTNNSPFNNHGMLTDFTNYSKPVVNVDDAFSKTYLTDVLNRHFSPECVVEEFSDTSHFTSPVCRDFHNNAQCAYESDVCSCFHGQFQNVDKYIGKNQNFIIESMTAHRHSQFNRDIYNDSTLYDIVPVREKTTKTLQEDNLPINEPKRTVDNRCWAESTRYKPRYQTTTVYHQTKPKTKYNNYKKSTPHVRDTEAIAKTKTPKCYRKNKVDKRTGHSDTSNSCHVDYSEIYPKSQHIKQKDEKAETVPTRPVFRKNAECLTIDLDTNNLSITRSIQIDINSTETTNEETLNQIKSILQSVLAEVKTNTQVNNVPEATSKKDAVIQKWPSQSNMQRSSSLLHSFTYNNSYNADPCLPSCSRQPPFHFCYANVPFQRPNYTQNFPLLIQTPGHPKCGCFFQNSNHRSTIKKQAANTATNTETNTNIEDQETNGTETDKLIKEIYKSLALTLESPKETSNSEYDELKSVTNISTKTSYPKEYQRTIVAMAGAPKTDVQTERSITPNSTITVRNNYNNNLTNTKNDGSCKKVEHYLDYDSPSSEHEILQAPKPEPNRGKATIASTISEHYSEELSSQGESEGEIETLEKLKKLEKKGLFKRILGSVKIFNKKNQKKRKGSFKQEVDQVDDEQSDSDSDDSQTIDSEKIHTPKHNFNINRYYNPSTRSYVPHRPVQQNTENQRMKTNRKSPYMEQEYRRQWNEQLMFQEDKARRYSSERPSLQPTPVYWQNYETRSAMVDQRMPYQTATTYNPIHPASVRPVIHKVEKRTSPLNRVSLTADKSKLSWLKKHKLDMSQCGQQWKKFILEN